MKPGGIFLLCVLMGLPLSAQTVPDIRCSDDAISWEIVMTGSNARFKDGDRTFEFEVAHETLGDPGPWPIALTLLSDRNTAITIFRPNENNGFDVDLLTQRGNLPVLLTGTCVPL